MSETRTHREATEWLIRLREDPGDHREFDAWRAASPDNARAWAEVSQAYDLIGQATAPVVVTMNTRRGWGLAAAAAIAAVIVLCCLPQWTMGLQADHATAAGEWRSVHLADG